MANTHDPVRRCSRTQMLGSAGKKRGREVRLQTKAGVGAQIPRSQTWSYISACHRYREGSPGSLVFKSIIDGD